MKPMQAIANYIRSKPRELLLFALASLIIGIASSMSDSVFNNFLNSQFTLTGFQRSFLEFPRELPGILVLLVSALLSFLNSRRLSALSMVLCALGAGLIGFASSSYNVMIMWLFIYSLGVHLFIPLSSTIGMELAREGQAGKRLGQFNAIRNLATIIGSVVIVLGFRYLHFDFQNAYLLIVLVFLVAAALLFTLKPQEKESRRTFLKLKKEYRLYYALVIIAGARKQIFLTFGPWVLVNIFNQPTQSMAMLYTIGGVIGVLFQPFLGKAIDRLGERTILAAEAVLLIAVCFGYGFAQSLLPDQLAFLLVCVCFLLDQMLMSVSMARSTYMKKIAIQPADIQTTLTAGVSMDHVFSIGAALLGGVIWNQFGYEYVFLMGAIIALVNFFTALRIKLPNAASQSNTPPKSMQV